MRNSKRNQLAEAEELVLEKLSLWLHTMDYQAAAQYCLEYLAAGTKNAFDDDLQRIFAALWFIENISNHGMAESKVVKPIADMCEVLLLRCGVQPVSSASANLYGRVYQALSAWHQSSGNAWQAMWQHSLGQYMTSATKGMKSSARGSDSEGGLRTSAAAQVMYAANHAYYLGHMTSAAAAYFVAESNADEATLRARARLGRIAALRLTGQVDSAHDLAVTAPFEFPDQTELHGDYLWQSLLCEVALHGDAGIFVAGWVRQSPLYQPRYALLSTLIAYAVASMPPRRKMRRVRTFKEHFQDDVGYNTREYMLIKQLLVLELCYDEGTSEIAKLKAVGDLLTEQQPKLQVEERLIFLAAIMRWLKRIGQAQFLSVMTNEYKSLCRILSNGTHTNVLGIAADILDDGDLAFSPNLLPYLSELPVTTGPRMLRVSKLVGRAALAMLAKKTGKRGAPGSINGGWDKFITDVVQLVADDVSDVKGPLMKAAQIFVGIGGASPEARQIMQTALAKTRPLEPKLLYEVFKREHGRYPQQIFRNWQTKPIGVGSMAQVFRAELPTGEPVAVKILYPRIAEIVAVDVNAIKLLRVLLRPVLPEVDVDRMAEIAVANVKSECDLRLEARYHQLVYDAFAGDPLVCVPKPYLEYNSTSVHVAEFVVSEHIADYGARIGKAEARRFWLLAFNTYKETLRRTHMAQIDPHAGNYRVQGDKIVLLDFGSMYRLDDKTRVALLASWDAAKQMDVKAAYQALCDYGTFDPAIVSLAIFERDLAPLIFQAYHPRFDMQQHQISKLLPLFFGGLREGITLSGELGVFYLRFFMFHSMLYTMDPGPAAPDVAA